MKLLSGMSRRVALVSTEVSQECIASFVRVIRISELGITLEVTSNRSTLRINTSSPTPVALMMEAIRSSETSSWLVKSLVFAKSVFLKFKLVCMCVYIFYIFSQINKSVSVV
jgi:hypothetical protein